MNAPVLKLENVRKAFGGVVATNDVSLEFPERSLSAIIGPNGAGKTTLFNLITGHLVPDSGRIVLAGEEIQGLKPAAIVDKGIGRAFQIASIFPSMTVEEALISAATAHMGQSGRLFQAFPPPAAKARADEMIELLQMGAVARRKCSNISHGDQKLLDVGLALALDPKVLLLDEPTAGMGPEERWEMINTVRRLWEIQAMTLIFIEHDMGIVFEIAQTINVLKYGAVLASGPPDAIRGNPDVIEAYLGTEIEEEA